MLEAWMRSYRPEELFDDARPARRRAGRARARAASGGWAPTRTRTAASCCATSTCPTSRDYARAGRRARRPSGTSRRASSASCCATSSRATRGRRTSGCSAPTRPTRTGSAPCSRSRTAASSSQTIAIDDHVSPDGRVMEVLSEHNCEGWLEGYLLTGRHGLFATYEAFAMVVASMTMQHAKWLEESVAAAVARAGAVAQHPADLDLLAQRPQRLQPPGPGLHRHDALEDAARSRASTCRPTPTACSRSPTTACAAANYVNLIVIDKQPQLQWLDMDAAREHCARGASIWEWAEQRRRRRAGRRARLRRRHPDAGDRRRRLVAAPARAGAAGARRQRRRPDDALPARVPSARHDRRPRSSSCSPPTSRSSSPSTATSARSTSSSTAARTPSASTCAATTRRARRPRRSTWSCSTR